MENISCVIFDLDGTLTRTNDLIFATFNHVAQKYCGRVYSPEEITAMFGPPEEVAVSRVIGEERLQEAMDDFHAFYESHYAEMAHLHDGIYEVLELLQSRGIVLAIFTGRGRRSTLATIEQSGIGHFFDAVVTGNDVEKYKPSANGIQKVMDQFGLSPSEVLMVGDAVSDVKAAREAGVAMAAALWDSYGRENVVQMAVEYRFESVKEFLNWLEKNVQPER